jgi:hypothetical protein
MIFTTYALNSISDRDQIEMQMQWNATLDPAFAAVAKAVASVLIFRPVLVPLGRQAAR